MAVGKVSWLLLSGACVVLLVALWLNRSDANQTQHRLQLILQGLLKTETEVRVNSHVFVRLRTRRDQRIHAFLTYLNRSLSRLETAPKPLSTRVSESAERCVSSEIFSLEILVGFDGEKTFGV